MHLPSAIQKSNVLLGSLEGERQASQRLLGKAGCSYGHSEGTGACPGSFIGQHSLSASHWDGGLLSLTQLQNLPSPAITLMKGLANRAHGPLLTGCHKLPPSLLTRGFRTTRITEAPFFAFAQLSIVGHVSKGAVWL